VENFHIIMYQFRFKMPLNYEALYMFLNDIHRFIFSLHIPENCIENETLKSCGNSFHMHAVNENV